MVQQPLGQGAVPRRDMKLGAVSLPRMKAAAHAFDARRVAVALDRDPTAHDVAGGEPKDEAVFIGDAQRFSGEPRALDGLVPEVVAVGGDVEGKGQGQRVADGSSRL